MAARLTALIVVTIVAVTVIAGLIVGAQRDDYSGPIDLIVFDAKVFPADGTAPFEGAVAIRGNQILRVGRSREVRRLRRPQTVEIDARGGALLPGFNDAHLHLLRAGLAMDRANLLGATTLPAIEAAIAAFASAHPDRPWVLGHGWDYGVFPGGLPARDLLDRVVPDRPALMTARDGHTSWVNSRALALAGITRRTPNPANGTIAKDPRTGEPTGALREGAQDLVRRHLPDVTRDERRIALRRAMAEAHRYGITSVQNASGSADEFELYDELRRAHDLHLRVYSAVSIDASLDETRLAELEALRAKYPDDALFKTGAVKLMDDGTIAARTAAMLAPYASPSESTPPPAIAGEALRRAVTMLDARGWQVMIHAAGDAAVRQALDAFETAARTNPAPARGRRHRVEHVEIIDAADLPRFDALGAIASMQPGHGTPDPIRIDGWAASLGPERAARGWACASIAGAGGRLAFGSGWPAAALDPRLGLNAAVNRVTPDGTPHGGWHPEQRLTLARALEAYTSGAAYASFDEHRKGRIAPGMLADLVLLSKDIFELPADRLLDAVVTHTIFDGRVVYERPET